MKGVELVKRPLAHPNLRAAAVLCRLLHRTAAVLQRRAEQEMDEVGEEELEALRVLAVGKRRRERSDSVTEEMIQERVRHLLKLRSYEAAPEVLESIERLGLGRKRQAADVLKYRGGSSKDPQAKSALGAHGFATYLGSASKAWPLFKHMVPEVALAGHSNCGKSSLVNALSGLSPKKGVARVSDRAGWTDLVSFYQIGKKPPLLILADLPGYGHAVASLKQKRAWREMMKDYVSNRPVLSRCCVLVDCLRGLCQEDREFMDVLDRREVPYQVVLTKGDLLDARQLAQSHAVVLKELQGRPMCCDVGGSGVLAMVSSASGAGVNGLWEALVRVTRADTVDKGGIALHRAAIR